MRRGPDRSYESAETAARRRAYRDQDPLDKWSPRYRTRFKTSRSANPPSVRMSLLTDTPTRGSTLTVDLILSKTTNLAGLDLSMTFEAGVLVPVSVAAGTAVASCKRLYTMEFPEDGLLRVVIGYRDARVLVSGRICLATFTVAADADLGASRIFLDVDGGPAIPANSPQTFTVPS